MVLKDQAEWLGQNWLGTDDLPVLPPKAGVSEAQTSMQQCTVQYSNMCGRVLEYM